MKKNILIILGASLYFFSQTGMVYAATYEYDDLGRVTKAVYEDGSSVTYVYDANGNMVETVTVSAEGDFNEGGQSGGQDNPEENADDKGNVGNTGNDRTDILDVPGDRNRENKENAGQDSGEETAGAGHEGTIGEKEGSDGEGHNKENKTESREGNENTGKNPENGDDGSTAAKIAGSIIGMFIAVMGLIGAFLWKKYRKETGTKEAEPKETGKKEPEETELYTSEKGRK